MFTSIYQIAGKTSAVIMEQNWFVKLILLLLSLLAPIATAVHILISLMLFNLAAAIYAQWKINIKKLQKLSKVKPCNFSKLRILIKTIDDDKLTHFFEVLVAYVLGIIACFIFDKYILKLNVVEFENIFSFSTTNLAILVLGSAQLISVWVNLYKITNEPIFKKIAALFNKKIDEKIDQL